MTEPTTTSPAPMGLFARAIGVITSPKATFQNIIAAPRPVGILLVVALVIGFATAAPQFSEAGREAVVQMQLKAMAARGQEPSPQVEDGMRRDSQFFPYVTIGSTLIILPIITLFITALYWGFFNVVLGGTAAYKQVLAVVTHSQVITALGVLVGLPFMLSHPSMNMGGPFNLGVLVPSLEEGSRLAKFLTSISVFSLWGTFVTAIGLSVLYKKKTAGIFIVILIVFLGFTYLGSMFRG